MVLRSESNDEPEESPPESDSDDEPEDTFSDDPSTNTEDQDFYDENCSILSFDSQDDELFFHDVEERQSWFSDDNDDEEDDCDILSDPPETPPESPIGSFFDDDKLDCMSYFSDDDEPAEELIEVRDTVADTDSSVQRPVSVKAAPPSEAALSDHPKYAKYFKMLKYGLPVHVVKSKMTQEGIDASILDRPDTDVIPVNFADSNSSTTKTTSSCKPSEESSVGTSGTGISSTDNSNSSDGTTGDGEKVALSDHVTYGRYFKMIRFGFSVDLVKSKMMLEGHDPEVITRSPSDMVSALPVQPAAAAVSRGVESKALLHLPTAAAPPSAAVVKVRRKTVRVKGVDASRVSASGGDSVWAADKEESGTEVQLQLDQEEFNRLFTEKVEPVLPKLTKTSVGGSAAPPTAAAAPAPAAAAVPAKKPKGVHLIDLKRAQNAAIALSRIKIPHEELRDKLLRFDDSNLTVDQLLAINEFLPTEKEASLIRQYKGDVTSLGHAEQFMRVMLDLPVTMNQRIGCMIYRQLFHSRQHDIREKLQAIEAACEDVRHSKRLKMVLRIVLKVVNHINSMGGGEGETAATAEAGITVDALLRLRETKAFDRKTTILQYVVTLIQRNDPDSLLFPSDLSHVSEASRLILEAISGDKTALHSEYEKNLAILEKIEQQEKEKQQQQLHQPTTTGSASVGASDSSTGGGPSDLTTIMSFFRDKAHHQCDEIAKKFARVKGRYSAVLSYFGEDPSLPSVEFFSTLLKFMQEFSATVDVVERIRKMEQRKAKAASIGRGKKPPAVSSNE